MIISYGPTVSAPKTFKSFPENVVIQMCAYSPEAFQEWAPFNVDKTVYLYNWGEYHHAAGFAPKRTPRYCVEQVRTFLTNRVRGIYICGGYSNAAGWGMEGPSMYAFGKALGIPDVDPDQIAADYASAAFSEAALPMRACFKAMHDRLEVFSLFNRSNYPLPRLPQPFKTQSDFFNHFFSAELVTDMDKNLQRARLLASQDQTKANLRLVEIEFEYVKRVADAYHMYRAYRMSPSVAALAMVGEKVTAFKQFVDDLFGGGIAPAAGLPEPFLGASRDLIAKNGRAVNAPFNWDFAFLKKNNLLPGVGMKRLFVEHADKVTLDGKLDDPAWQKAKFEELGEMSMGAVKNPTRFKVLYDDAAFYIGVECVLGSLDQIATLKAVGRDGAAFYQECVEVMLDPFGAREKHYHFLINPVPDSAYDARYAFIADPLDPRYGKRDETWNGDWDYAAVIDKENLKWSAEIRIPYTALEVEPPKPGTAWAMNLGREEYPKGHGKGNPVILSLWSPNLEAGGFHSRAVFGDVMFK